MPFALLAPKLLEKCKVSELQKSARGQQFAEICFEGGDEKPIFQLSKAPLTSPFSASVFQEDPQKPATRLNLDLTLDAATKETLEAFDRYFSEKLKEIAPNKNWHKLVQENAGYPARVRCKINVSGPSGARIWGADQTALGNIRQVDTCGASLTACVRIGKLWIMGPSAGLSLECAHLVIADSPSSANADVFPL